MTKPEIDKHSVQAGFNRAAHSYDSVAFLQEEICNRLIERLQWIKHSPQTILDLGSGTGTGSLALKKYYPKARIIALDLAEEMLKFAQVKVNNNLNFIDRFKRSNHINHICADAESLPFKNQTFDLIFSNLSIQWCENYPLLFSEFSRILKPEGFLQFSTFGVDTLKELRQCWQSVSSFAHVNEFIDLHDLGDFMLGAGLKDPIVDAEFITIEYSQINNLVHELKKLGAQNHLQQRPKSLQGKNQFKQMLTSYEQFKLENNKYPATYEVIYGHAWAKDLQVTQNTAVKTNQQFVQVDQNFLSKAKK